MDDPPPPYEFKEAPPAANQQAFESSSSAQARPQAPPPSHQSAPPLQPALPQQQPPQSLPLATALHSNQAISIYSAGPCDLYLVINAKPPPLAHVTVRPSSISLHSTGSAESPVLATAQFYFLSPPIIEIAPRTAPAQKPIREELVKTSWMPDAWTFEMPVVGPASLGCTGGNSGCRERFEWKHSRGGEVTVLQGTSRGLKCVRVNTGEVVCAWAWDLTVTNVGRFWWVLNANLGDETELMVVLTLIVLLEKIRTDENCQT